MPTGPLKDTREGVNQVNWRLGLLFLFIVKITIENYIKAFSNETALLKSGVISIMDPLVALTQSFPS